MLGDRAGVVRDDAGVIQHAGNPVAEQRRLAAGAAVAPRGDRAIVSLTGPDRLTWLDSITSQQVATLQPGESTEFLVLDPQGRVEHVAGVLDDGETAWLLVDRDDAAGLAKWLTMMRFRMRVEIAVRDDLAVVAAFRGGAAADRLVETAERGGEIPLVWADPWPAVVAGGWQYAEAAEHPGSDYHWVEAIVRPDADLGELPVAGAIAADALRVAAWRPRWANEVDGRTIPHEADWLRTAVHLDKGCYRGQETVAKVHNLGHPPRRLVLLHLDGSENVPAEPGDAVVNGDAEVGHVTSVANHHELGPVALAIVSRRTPSDAPLVVVHDDTRIAAAQEVIVPADAGSVAEIPKITRLSRRS
ncbi:YgfZ/GcvT domain-containing protein [Microbacterium indicum]|uniref:CAF17-like 4Fe-4S cluster assembly/insertion protein YgfZ n=1 Tax=Microbacterium indicum TaxID=358100 RepID=UPI00041A1DC2|nr:glycine cleavage T C-terminal barrel domain-containing protein [Microbacterium indicum]